jgi:hypothetical protein
MVMRTIGFALFLGRRESQQEAISLRVLLQTYFKPKRGGRATAVVGCVDWSKAIIPQEYSM